MNSRSTGRGRFSSLLVAILPTRRHVTADPCPEQHRLKTVQMNITRPPLTTKARIARQELVFWTLRQAAWGWESRPTLPTRRSFEQALGDFVAEVAPHVTVTPYDYGQSATDEAYRAVQKAALYLAYVDWDNGRETAAASSTLDYADDQLDEALYDYIAAASGS
ncbi:hypothetical protein [Spirillospora sp. CA-128828]|uniref:hypothetical protein n=1 Tax=Spirillospora sp. CA-128828 TaxID=3240033 RepID=UPI003D8A1905